LKKKLALITFFFEAIFFVYHEGYITKYPQRTKRAVIMYFKPELLLI